MELYLDTANVAEVERLARIFPIAGVTTNPSINAKQILIKLSQSCNSYIIPCNGNLCIISINVKVVTIISII